MLGKLNKLPREVLDIILERADHGCLANLSLTSKLLQQLCRQYLYGKIVWNYDRDPDLRLDWLYRTLRERPDLAALTTAFSLHGSNVRSLQCRTGEDEDGSEVRFSIERRVAASSFSHCYPDALEYIQRSLLLTFGGTDDFAEEYALDLLEESEGFRAHDLLTSMIVGRLPNLERLHIGYKLIPWDTYDVTVNEALQSLARTPGKVVCSKLAKVRHLSLSHDFEFCESVGKTNFTPWQAVSQTALCGQDLLAFLFSMRLQSLTVMVVVSNCGDPFWRHVTSCCPTLTDLVLRHSQLDESDLGNILRCTPKLRRLRCDVFKSDGVADEQTGESQTEAFDYERFLASLLEVRDTLESLELSLICLEMLESEENTHINRPKFLSINGVFGELSALTHLRHLEIPSVLLGGWLLNDDKDEHALTHVLKLHHSRHLRYFRLLPRNLETLTVRDDLWKLNESLVSDRRYCIYRWLYFLLADGCYKNVLPQLKSITIVKNEVIAAQPPPFRPLCSCNEEHECRKNLLTFCKAERLGCTFIERKSQSDAFL